MFPVATRILPCCCDWFGAGGKGLKGRYCVAVGANAGPFEIRNRRVVYPTSLRQTRSRPGLPPDNRLVPKGDESWC